MPRQLSPIAVQGAVTGIRFMTAEAGHLHTLAASKSGEVYCWGANDYGQLGLGDLEDRNAPHALLHKFTRSKVFRTSAAKGRECYCYFLLVACRTRETGVIGWPGACGRERGGEREAAEGEREKERERERKILCLIQREFGREREWDREREREKCSSRWR